MICWGEELIWHQFRKTRADCCKSFEAYSIPHYLYFVCAAAFLERDLQSSAPTKDFMFSLG